MDKFEVIGMLERLYTEDQECSRACDGSKYEKVCDTLQGHLGELFGE